jgi:hypothetical protein
MKNPTGEPVKIDDEWRPSDDEIALAASEVKRLDPEAPDYTRVERITIEEFFGGAPPSNLSAETLETLKRIPLWRLAPTCH